MMTHNRQSERVTVVHHSVHLSLAPQLTIFGELKDISLSGAFVRVKNRIYFENDTPIDFMIKRTKSSTYEWIEGSGIIARIAHKDGIGIRFTDFKHDSSSRLKRLIFTHLHK